MSNSNDRIEARRDLIRGGLIGLAAPVVVVAGWALIAPHGWYSTFPGGGRHWVSALGAYDEHLVRDFAATYLALGFGFDPANSPHVRLLRGARDT